MGQKVFDWAKLAARVPQEAKAEFGAFRSRHEACRARLVKMWFCVSVRVNAKNRDVGVRVWGAWKIVYTV